MRFLAAGLLLILLSLLQKKDLRIRRGSAGMLLAFALVNTTLHYLFSYIGLAYLPSARSSILNAMGSFLLIALSSLIFEDDRFSRKKALGCALGVLGIVAINVAPSEQLFANISFLGDGMILLNVCCAAAGGLMTRPIAKKMDMVTATGYGMSAGGLFLLVIALCVGRAHPRNLTPKALLILTALILISAVCFGIYNLLLVNHPISKIAIYDALIPVFGVIFSCLLLHEPFTWNYALAGLLVASGIYVINRRPRGDTK